ncbi:hypothetical protein BANRA_05154 [Klebsiella pneumoniae]|nr:hypothetical protein BANRA_05154 [Klebsiella pneumoniae]
MTIMKVHYSPTDGIPLHSLYLKELQLLNDQGSVLGAAFRETLLFWEAEVMPVRKCRRRLVLLSLHHLMKLLLSLTTQKWSSGFPVLSV